jgi:hypothetical protein
MDTSNVPNTRTILRLTSTLTAVRLQPHLGQKLATPVEDSDMCDLW